MAETEVESYSGTLYKKGSLLHAWKKRYGSLKDGRLSVSKQKDGKAKHVVDVRAIRPDAIVASAKSGKHFPFVIGEHKHVYGTTSAEETERWLAELRNAGFKHPQISSAVSTTALATTVPGQAAPFTSSTEDVGVKRQLDDSEINALWNTADRDGDGKLTKEEVVRLLDRLNVKLKRSLIERTFKEVDINHDRSFDRDEFAVFIAQLQTRREVAAIYEQLTKDTLSAETLLNFLHTEQRQPHASLSDARHIINSHEHQNDIMLRSGLQAYLTSAHENGIVDPERMEKVWQEMEQPLHHYWVASSHNTYLLADQLAGASSIEAYKNAFALGCKCVELDCWDAGEAEPIVYHGHTLTSKINFREILVAVREFGFKTSPYPVILSLEMHCKLDGQRKIAEILREELGSMLPASFVETGRVGTPHELRNKVLIKGKMLALTSAAAEPPQPEETRDAGGDEAGALGGLPTPGDLAAPIVPALPAVHPVDAELSKLTHLRTVGFKSFADAAEKTKDHDISSFSEVKLASLLQNGPADMIALNQRQMSRIFPKGTRVDSSNYDPTPGWVSGCSVVALNYQTQSLPLWLNQGKFCENGRSGYVLKPAYLRTPGAAPPTPTTLTIIVISAWKLPKTQSNESKSKGEVVDPYVRLSIHGAAADERTVKTNVISNNGFNPVWNSKFEFTISNPEVAMMMVQVYDKDFATADDLLGQFAAPINMLRSGYRTVPLSSKNHEPFQHSTLFFNVSFR